MRIIPAEKSQSRIIAELIMEAMNYECCTYFMGKKASLQDFEDMMTGLVADDKSQYSYLNTTVAITDDNKIAGICVTYDGAKLHQLRVSFVQAAKKCFNRDYSNITDETSDGELYIDSLAVKKEYRHKGIASKLIRQTFDKACKMGINRVGLLVDVGNPKAEQLYTSLGFHSVGNSSWGGHAMKHMQTNVLNNNDETSFSFDNVSIDIKRMAYDEYENGFKRLNINYSFAPSPFGEILIASTDKGICCLMFADNHKEAYLELASKFPKANFNNVMDEMQRNAIKLFTKDRKKVGRVCLHLYGTAFQLKVWETLLKIPFGELKTYGQIVTEIGKPNACRAVGKAVGCNPIAFIIPCHRVILSTGKTGHYHWGDDSKKLMIDWESAEKEADTTTS